MISLNINGQTYQVNVDSGTPLLWVLRDILGLTGTKYGCGIEICGACTVMIDGQAQKSCDMDVGSAAGRTITTIEGLDAFRLPTDAAGSPGVGQRLQQAWITEQVPQCGYCQSGMLMSAAALLKQKANPTDSDIAEIHNVCICGTYQRVKAAIHRAASGA